jgi:hypothetical protein
MSDVRILCQLDPMPGKTMSAPEPSPEFKRDLRTVVGGARAWLSVAFAIISADLVLMLVPRQHAWWACGVVGGTMVMVC